jgi:hypothetical protein
MDVLLPKLESVHIFCHLVTLSLILKNHCAPIHPSKLVEQSFTHVCRDADKCWRILKLNSHHLL